MTLTGIHNIIFAQLSTIAFTMKELGLGYEEVLVTILEMSRSHQLVEEQEHELIRCVRRTFGVNPVARGSTVAPSVSDATGLVDTNISAKSIQAVDVTVDEPDLSTPNSVDVEEKTLYDSMDMVKL